jgi:hypothetical protein
VCDILTNIHPFGEAPDTIHFHISAFHPLSFELCISRLVFFLSLATTHNFLEHLFAHIYGKSFTNTNAVCWYLFYLQNILKLGIMTCSCHVTVPLCCINLTSIIAVLFLGTPTFWITSQNGAQFLHFACNFRLEITITLPTLSSHSLNTSLGLSYNVSAHVLAKIYSADKLFLLLADAIFPR